MKNLIITLLVAAASATAVNAQTYQPAVVRGSVLGAIAGAFIGGHNNDQWAQGAVIGAAAGAVLGAIVDDSRPAAYYPAQVAQPVYVRTTHAQPAYVQTSYAAPCAAPQVIYVTTPSPRRVVYVRSYRAPVVVSRPVVYVPGENESRRHHPQYRNW